MTDGSCVCARSASWRSCASSATAGSVLLLRDRGFLAARARGNNGITTPATIGTGLAVSVITIPPNSARQDPQAVGGVASRGAFCRPALEGRPWLMPATVQGGPWLLAQDGD